MAERPGWRRNRRTSIAVVASAAVLAAGVVFLTLALDDGLPPTLTSTARPTTVSSTPVAPTGSTVVAHHPTTTSGSAGADTTVAACRNSTDAACGPFRLDPPPGPDSPLTVEVGFEPATPVAGREVVFHLVLRDADGVSHGSSLFDFGDAAIGDSASLPCEKFGPWDLAARNTTPGTETMDVRHTYIEAGTYTASFSFDAGPFACVDGVTGRGDRPYATSGQGTVVVVVDAAV